MLQKIAFTILASADIVTDCTYARAAHSHMCTGHVKRGTSWSNKFRNQQSRLFSSNAGHSYLEAGTPFQYYVLSWMNYL